MAIADLDAIILAGGLGTRLRPVLPDRQKVFAPVAGEPFITRLFALLQTHGIRRCILALGHRSEDALPYLGPWSRRYGVELVPSVEPGPLGTGGALRLALSHCHSDRLLALNGDSYVAADLQGLDDAHARYRARATLCTVRVDDVGRYGQLDWSEETGRINAFREKSAAHAGMAGWINAGIYLLDRGLIEGIPEHAAASLEKDVLAASIGQGLYAYPCDGAFIDIGLPETYRASADFFTRLEAGRPDPAA
ncbi:MAG TPA: sugar phosphate nucleotidyltransferase [Rhodocyclaceae bacterium]